MLILYFSKTVLNQPLGQGGRWGRGLLASAFGDSVEGCLGLLEPQPCIEFSEPQSPACSMPRRCVVDAKSAAQDLGRGRGKKKTGWKEGIEEMLETKTDKTGQR